MSHRPETPKAETGLPPAGAIRCGKFLITPWPSLQVTPAHGFSDGDAILRPDPDSPYLAFMRHIPQKILQMIRAFPNQHWRLLELCAGDPVRSMELLSENPALAVLTVEHCNSPAADRRRRDLNTMVGRPWRGLLAELGLPTRPRTLRILRRLPVEHCTPLTTSRLRQVLRTSGHPWVHVLPHLPLITRDTVALLGLEPQLITPELMRATLDSAADVETVAWLLDSLRALRAELGRTGPWPYRGLNLEQLKLLEGTLTTQAIPDYFAVFPPPPLAGKAGWIVPLRDFAALAEEGDKQANCAVMYLSSVLAQEAYVFALLKPERATFVLQRRDRSAPWALADLRCFGNAAPAETTRAFVKAWLSNAH